MTKPEFKYFKGNFTGFFTAKESRHTGLYNYAEMRWDYLHIENISEVSVSDLSEFKAGDYWYKKKVRDKKWYRFLYHTTELFLPLTDSEQTVKSRYQGDLHHVILRDFNTNPKTGLPNIKRISNNQFEMAGTIYFALPLPPKPSPPKSISRQPIIRSKGNGINILSAFKIRSSIPTSNSQPQHNQIDPTTNSPSYRNRTGCLSLFGNGFSFVYWLAALYYLWHSVPWLFWTVAIAGIIWFVLKLLNASGLGRILGYGLLLFLIYYWFNNFKSVKQQFDPEDTQDGNVKILPPKEDTKNQNSNERDYLTEKQITWWDFIKNNFSISYSTSSLKFLDVQKHNDPVRNFQGRNEVEIYTKVYNHMVNFDNRYIDSVVLTLKEQATRKKLNKIQTAEMVVTMIQEIPYCLVHDLSCKEVVKQSGGGFIEEYHEDGGPCLPNIPAGLQSPYQFLHNLKGDCDTRSVLGHLLLTRLGIGSSVWVSTEYGHSILGVALPVGSGSYKTIRGVKHYAVELTAKGFRLGMIAPEQRNMNNWNITLYRQ